MYGVDVISALNKANNNNEKYIVGSFLSGDLSGEEFIIDIIVTLKSTTPLQDTITVSYLDDKAFRDPNAIVENSSLVERDYYQIENIQIQYILLQQILQMKILQLIQ